MPKPISLFAVILVLALADLDSPPKSFAQEKALGDKVGQQDPIRRDVDVVSIYFTVRDDQKRLVSDLPQDKFTVSEDGRPQAIRFFAHHSDVVLNVGVLVDIGTNVPSILGEEVQASSLFVKHVVRPTDLGFILSYASHVETVQMPTSDIPLLEEQARTIQAAPPPARGMSFPSGGTMGIDVPTIYNRESHLYDALHIAAERYLAGEVGRKAVVVVSLSDDLGSESSTQDALQALLKNDVIAYVLQIRDGRGRCLSPCCLLLGKSNLKMPAEATGGRELGVKGIDKLEAALDAISDELHHQYSLGYYPENKNWDGKFRKIQISAGEKGYKVYARKGYYANRPTDDVAPTQ